MPLTLLHLVEQAKDGAWQGPQKRKQLLVELERHLYRLDEIRAAGGQKLSPQVRSFRAQPGAFSSRSSASACSLFWWSALSVSRWQSQHG